MPHRASKLKGFIWLAVAISVGVSAALGLPHFAARVPWSVEQRLSNLIGGLPSQRACASPQLRKIVARIFPLYPTDRSLPISVEIIRGETVNAFASLGGHIFVFEGLLRQFRSPEELAGVLAHEIEHVRRRHIMQGALAHIITAEVPRLVISRPEQMDGGMVNLLLQMKFSREQEREADEGGVVRLRDAEIDIQGFANILARLGNEGTLASILSDHPSSDSRAELIQRFSGGIARPILDPGEWGYLRQSCVQ